MTDLLDIKVDVVFKDFFGDKNSKEFLESFINSILGLKGDETIAVEEFLDPRKMRVEVGNPITFLDLSVKTKGGERYIIEVQTCNPEGVNSLISSLQLLYFLGKDYTEQLKCLRDSREEGKRRKNNWPDLHKVHVIAIIDFHSSYIGQDGLINGKNATETYAFKPVVPPLDGHLFDKWKATLVDLKKFKNTPLEELETRQEKWFFLLKNSFKLKEKEVEHLKKDPIFKKALEKLERLSSDPKTRKKYEASINAQRDHAAIMRKGEKKGEKSKAITIAKSLLKKGMSSDEVSEITGLPQEAFQSLTKKL